MTYRAVVRVNDPGGLPRVVVTELAMEPPGPGEVRVRVRAAVPDSIQQRRADTVPASGVPGSVLVGIVDAVGPDVTGWAAGDEVLAVVRSGACAEFAVVPASALFHVPAGVDPVLAALVPLHALPAAMAVDLVGAGAGSRVVLVDPGNVRAGYVARLLEEAGGARIVGAAPLESHAALADEPYHSVVPCGPGSTARLLDALGGPAHAVFDLSNALPADTAAELLAPGGRVIRTRRGGRSWVRWTDHERSTIGAQLVEFSLLAAVARDLAAARTLADDLLHRLTAGRLAMPVDRYALDDAATAFGSLRHPKRGPRAVVLVP